MQYETTTARFDEVVKRFQCFIEIYEILKPSHTILLILPKNKENIEESL